MKKPFIAIFTETRSAGVPPPGSAVASAAVPALAPGRDAVTAALLVVFANRDAQTLDDVEGTKVNLEGQGEGVHVREFDFLREIPDLWDLRQEAADRAEADRIIAERLAVPPNNPASQPSINPEAVAAIHQ